MTDTNDTKYSFFLFNGTNYAEWKFQSRVYAQKIKALSILEGTMHRPADTDEPAQKEFDTKNEQLFHHLFATMKSAQQQLLRDFARFLSAMDKLRSNICSLSTSRRLVLQ